MPAGGDPVDPQSPGDRRFRPQELAAFVLRQLKEDAERFLNEEVTEAVVSVPAYFNDNQRYATKEAGQLAGLKVERLVNEPSAAALAASRISGEEGQCYLVFDFGGGNHEPEMRGERGSDVLSYFWEEQKRQKEKLEVFLEEWDEIVKNYGFPPAFQRWEDYGLKLLSHYGEPYWLRFETMEGYGSGYVYKDYGRYRDYVVFYSGIEDADRICDSLFKILGEEEKGQLSYLDSIGICWENALYPKAMIEGGVQKRPPAQIYGVEDLTDAAAQP